MQRGQMGLPQREHLNRVWIPEPQAHGRSEVSGMSGIVATWELARFRVLPATAPEPISQDKHDKQRQGKLPSPAPGLANQTVEPLETRPPDEPRRARHPAGEVVERAAHANRDQYAMLTQPLPVGVNPEILGRMSEGNQQHGRPGIREPPGNLSEPLRRR